MNLSFSKIRKIQSRRQGERGVALIFYMLVFGLLLGFTMMVFNTGILIYQKMRLQSAVDLAAYAGASVQASYLGNEQSGENSIRGVNNRIIQRYSRMVEELQSRRVNLAYWPTSMPDIASCMAACQASNYVVASNIISTINSARDDIDIEHRRVQRLLQEMPQAVKLAMEKTLELNVPDLIADNGNFDGTTKDVFEVIGSNDDDFLSERKNAALSFTNSQGMYLSQVLANVPHRAIFFGPACWPADPGNPSYQFWFCSVNGSGGPGYTGLGAAALAYARAISGQGEISGNIGSISKISEPETQAMRLHFIEDPHRPEPFVVAASEWYPKEGKYMSFENSLGAQGSLFPGTSRLVAVSGAEPFGGSLASESYLNYGTRLQAIRKLLLDPRMESNRDDFMGLFDYMQFLSPRDREGQALESTEEVIKRFLH